MSPTKLEDDLVIAEEIKEVLLLTGEAVVLGGLICFWNNTLGRPQRLEFLRFPQTHNAKWVVLVALIVAFQRLLDD